MIKVKTRLSVDVFHTSSLSPSDVLRFLVIYISIGVDTGVDYNNRSIKNIIF